MFDIDGKIKDVDDVICENIDLIESMGRGLASQNILAQTRNLLEYVAIKAYSTVHEINHDRETNENAREYLKSDYKYLFIRKFHSLIQESKLMILANLGQRSCNSRTTFPKYTDSVLELFGQGTLSQRDKLTS